MIECELCPDGSFSSGNSSECLICAADTYSDGKGASVCIDCPEGRSTQGKQGGNHVDDCATVTEVDTESFWDWKMYTICLMGLLIIILVLIIFRLVRRNENSIPSIIPDLFKTPSTRTSEKKNLLSNTVIYREDRQIARRGNRSRHQSITDMLNSPDVSAHRNESSHSHIASILDAEDEKDLRARRYENQDKIARNSSSPKLSEQAQQI